MNALAQLTLDQFQGAIRSSGASIRIADLPTAMGDVTALGQVIANLLDNALKYLEPTRLGLIEIGGMNEGTHTHFWIRDNGVGIPEHARKRLFQVFQRFHPEHASGDGIGLAAIKRIVERHNGRLWLESETSIGSSFHFTIGAATTEGGQS
jgi:signal transduction histidine kinase